MIDIHSTSAFGRPDIRLPFLGRVKRLVVGRALRNDDAPHQRLSKKVGLAVFSSDALSSTAYASEEILLVLAVAVAFGQARAFEYLIPVSIGIALLLAIVTISYRQTIRAYPAGGGAYIVAKENLGTLPGLTAGASLLIDYVLTVSVSVAAGVAAITSAAQGTGFAWISDYKVGIGVVLVALICVANLRGVRESGSLFALPTYAFLASFLFMIAYGLVYFAFNGAPAAPVGEEIKLAEGYAPQALTLFLVMAAFSNGCSALTGVEAISNGVQAFKEPESRNASRTLVTMAVLLGVMFLGTSTLAYLFGVHPHADETVISQFARQIFTGGMGWFYFVVQASTAAILVLAANTAFADFPRLASLLARDRFLPRQLANKGDKLVFSNGIVILAVFSSVLIFAFAGDTSRLIPLYAVGVFLSFTLSQAGMVRHWLRGRPGHSGGTEAGPSISEQEELIPDIALARENLGGAKAAKAEGTGRGWRKPLVINLLGAIATGIVLCVFIVTKFTHGAWLVVVTIPLLILMFRVVHKHYVSVASQLSTDRLEPLSRAVNNAVIVPVSGVHRGIINALNYARSIGNGNVKAVYVDSDEEETRLLTSKWEEMAIDVPLVVLRSPYRELTRPLLRYVEEAGQTDGVDVVTVVLPEFVPSRWWQHLLHNQSSLLLKGALLFKPGIVVTNVPYHLR